MTDAENKPDEFQTYLFEYHHCGSDWSFEIPATSLEDAQARVNKLPLARYVGILHAKIPAYVPGAGLFVRFWCWWKSLRGASE